MAATPAVGSASPSRSADRLPVSRHQAERRTRPSDASRDGVSEVRADDERVRIGEPLDEVRPGSLSLSGIEVRRAPIWISDLAGMVHYITGNHRGLSA
jgi:hypothetical protein